MRIINNFKKLTAVTTFVCFTLLSFPGFAMNEAMLDLLKILRDKGSLTETEYELLVNASKADAEKVEGKAHELQAKVDKKVDEKTKSIPKITTKGKLELATEDHKFRIGGRVMHDATFVNNDGSGNVGSSEQQFRRARIYMSGTAWKHWDWKFQYDMEDADDSSQAIEDAYIKYKGLDAFDITVGQRKAPFSLNELTSSKYITFIERSTASNLFASSAFNVGNRAPGITLSAKRSNWSAEGGVYMMRQRGSATDDDTFTTSDGATVDVELGTDSIAERKIDDGIGFTGRLTYLPLNDSKANKLVHLGAAFGYKNYANNSIGRFRVRPAVSEGDRIVDSDGSIAAEGYWSVGVEAATIMGPFAAQAEYYHGEIDDIGLGGDTDLDGWYVQGSYFLTGDSRRYKGNAFTSVKVKRPVGEGGWGAWEVGLRYSEVDLGSAIGNDEGGVLTAALNWYVNNNMMFKANYVQTFCDGGGQTCDWGAGDGDPGYFILRTQLFF